MVEALNHDRGPTESDDDWKDSCWNQINYDEQYEQEMLEREIPMKEEKLNIAQKLMNVQHELKAPKGQTNNFGHYKYRSCEDILEAVKPLLFKYELVLTISDNITQIGDRYYVNAIASIRDTNLGTITASASARESFDKKGMDDSQITGTASSYARKYALNGLFAIDDTKDADTDEYEKQNKKTTKIDDYRTELVNYCKDNELDLVQISKQYGLTRDSQQEEFKTALVNLKAGK
jgi:hypothetical protein